MAITLQVGLGPLRIVLGLQWFILIYGINSVLILRVLYDYILFFFDEHNTIFIVSHKSVILIKNLLTSLWLGIRFKRRIPWNLPTFSTFWFWTYQEILWFYFDVFFFFVVSVNQFLTRYLAPIINFNGSFK